MTRRKSLGELEQLVLLTVLRLDEHAYGMSIRREIEARTGRDVAIGAVYSALDRMERKGFITSRVGEPKPVPGGRARRLFRVEASGREALRASLADIRSLLAGLAIGEDWS
jgi:PadR family transcriptional regulator PadR